MEKFVVCNGRRSGTGSDRKRVVPDRLVSVVVAAYVLSDLDLPLAEAVGRMLREKVAVPGAS